MKKLTWIFILFLVILAGAFLWFIAAISNTKDLPTQETANIIDYEKLDRLEKLKSPGQSTNVNEPGFGRTDPFTPY